MGPPMPWHLRRCILDLVGGGAALGHGGREGRFEDRARCAEHRAVHRETYPVASQAIEICRLNSKNVNRTHKSLQHEI